LEAAGAVRCWGFNGGGQLGDGTTDNSFRKAVQAMSGVSSLSLGFDHSCATTTDRKLYCWGSNAEGAVGTEEGTMVTVPTLIHELDEVVQVSAGRDFTCAMTADGRVWCWGANRNGELGLSDGAPRRRPTEPVPYK